MADGPPSILTLPVEITVKIFEILDFQDILRCAAVCRHFKDIIEASTLLQYNVALAANGSQDGPACDMTTIERMQRLQTYSAAWRELKYTHRTEVTLGTWGNVYGATIRNGVLAWSRDDGLLLFTQLPSRSRRIARRDWSQPVGFYARECAIDPSQDVLVLVGTPNIDDVHPWFMQFRSLTSGESHPLAAPIPDIVGSLLPTGFLIGTITPRVIGDLLAFLVQARDSQPDYLIIWNWKSGEIRKIITGRHICRFAFISPSLILITATQVTSNAVDPDNTSEPCLLVYDLQEDGREAQPTIVLGLPRLAPRLQVNNIIVHCDPVPMPPSTALRVPFGLSQAQRLLIVSYTIYDRHDHEPITHFIPLSTILSYSTAPRPYEAHSGLAFIPWEKWAAWPSARTRLERGNVNVDSPVSGMRFITPLKRNSDGEWATRIWDFNPHRLRMLQRAPQAQLDSPDVVIEGRQDDGLRPRDFFLNGSVNADLSFVMREVAFPHSVLPSPTSTPAAGITEDAIVVFSDFKSRDAVAYVYDF
ncbi:hypothetical protein FA95DRAFT_1556928 [Auriscalpium vulgare]|uniref:Uncharacterized protein n=1 Tax=Auriscalpium vulgare TaxID=40419 RepID=A0ACB8RZB8_9AGAM|nr:hypothetical protein FA95DRAFT_1556928 [Auriscalpium vulgare]